MVLQHRSARTHQGNTWGLMGGAIERGEDPVAAALREAHEEGGLSPSTVRILSTVAGLRHPEWSYTYVLAETPRPVDPDLPGGRTWEALRTMWIDLDRIAEFTLHPGLRTDWHRLRELLSSAG